MQSFVDTLISDLADFLTGDGELPWRPEAQFLRPPDDIRDQLLAELRVMLRRDAKEALTAFSAAMRRLTADPDAVADRILALHMAELRLRHHVEELANYDLTEADLRLLCSASALASSLDHQAEFAVDVLSVHLEQVARGVA